MPQDILVGEDAEKVADFLAANSGSEVPPSFAPESTPEPRRVALSARAAGDVLASRPCST